jgi:hypothetical protein
LKRKERLREGLQRISEKRLLDLLQVITRRGQPRSVQEARKIVEGLPATLPLRGEHSAPP